MKTHNLATFYTLDKGKKVKKDLKVKSKKVKDLRPSVKSQTEQVKNLCASVKSVGKRKSSKEKSASSAKSA